MNRFAYALLFAIVSLACSGWSITPKFTLEHEIDRNNKLKIELNFKRDEALDIDRKLTQPPGLRPRTGLRSSPRSGVFDLNVQGKNGRTVLHHAARHATDPQVILTLLDLGADPRIQDDRGRTAVDYAERNPHLNADTVLAALP